MKRYVTSLLIVLVLASFISGCVTFPSPFPDQGIWYSSELNMYLNVETETGYKMNEGGSYEFFHYHLDHGNGIHFVFCEITDEHSADLDSLVENAYYSRNGEILTIEFRDSGEKYEYVRVSEDDFPCPVE